MLTSYFKIIRQAIKEDRSKDGDIYYEAHHIIPKSFGKKSSIVLLTADEHYRVHRILVECFKDHSLYAYKVYWAFHRMSYDGSKTLTEQEYKEAREMLMPLWKRKKSIEHKKRIGKSHKGKKQVINPITGEFKFIGSLELQNYLDLGWINSNKSIGTKRSEYTKKILSTKATESKLGKVGEESRASKGIVIYEDQNGNKIEAGSANLLSKLIGIKTSTMIYRISKRPGEMINGYKVYYK